MSSLVRNEEESFCCNFVFVQFFLSAGKRPVGCHSPYLYDISLQHFLSFNSTDILTGKDFVS